MRWRRANTALFLETYEMDFCVLLHERGCRIGERLGRLFATRGDRD